jgi:hypothetical protein
MLFQVALDDAVGAIIHHAEKCRKSNERTLHLALVEFCASRLWFRQHQEMDPSDYFLGAEYNDDSHDGIRIKIHAIRSLPGTPALYSMEFDETLSQIVLTPEAMNDFQSEQKKLLQEQQETNDRQRAYEKELTEYYRQF